MKLQVPQSFTRVDLDVRVDTCPSCTFFRCREFSPLCQHPRPAHHFARYKTKKWFNTFMIFSWIPLKSLSQNSISSENSNEFSDFMKLDWFQEISLTSDEVGDFRRPCWHQKNSLTLSDFILFCDFQKNSLTIEVTSLTLDDFKRLLAGFRQRQWLFLFSKIRRFKM